jgi:hypothetical protein
MALPAMAAASGQESDSLADSLVEQLCRSRLFELFPEVACACRACQNQLGAHLIHVFVLP